MKWLLLALAIAVAVWPVLGPRLRGRRPVDPWAELLADPTFHAAMERGRADIAAGRVVPWSEVRRQMEWRANDEALRG